MFYIVGILHLTGYTEFAIAQNKAFVSLIWATLGVFTFLSSFLLASKYSFNTGSEVMTFYKKRVLRFYPLFLISSLLLLLIHFNTWPETWKGLLGLSPFWTPQQHTLWYIAMLIGLYLLTPFFCRGSIKYQLVGFICCMAIILVIDATFHSVDPRVYYYYIVYFAGILSAKYWQSGFLKLINSKYTLLLLSIYLPLFGYLLMGKGNRILMMCEGYIGIVALLNICACVGNVLQSNRTFTKVISYLSYASMCAYLFHREVYWMLMALYTPSSNDWYIILYLFFIGVPVTFFLSYYIQRGYDKLVSRI